MQSRYAKLEYDNARSLWLNCRQGQGDGEFEYEATFATLVEQVRKEEIRITDIHVAII